MTLWLIRDIYNISLSVLLLHVYTISLSVLLLHVYTISQVFYCCTCILLV